MFLRVALLNFVLISSAIANSENLDSLSRRLTLGSPQNQLDLVRTITFNTVVENTQEIIPILKKYEPIAISEKDFITLAKIYSNLSLAYYYRGKYDENLKYGLKAANLFDSLGSKIELGTMYGELGYQMKYRKLKKATALMYKGMMILQEIGDPEPLAKIYDNYGVLKEINNQVDSAIYYYQKALEIKIDSRDSLGIPYSLNNLYMANMLMDRPATAVNFLDESTKIRSTRKDSIGLAENYGYYGHYYSYTGDHNKAIEFNRKALNIALKRNYVNLVKSAYLDLSNNYETIKDYEQALIYRKLFSSLQDSLINIETNKTIADLQVQYETAEKEKELIKKSNQLEREQVIKIITIISALSIILLLVIYFRNKILTSRRNETIKVQNALIEGEQTERNRLALELHDGIASDLNGIILLLRNTLSLNEPDKIVSLDKSIQHLNQTHQNVRKLSHTLMPRSLKEKGLSVALEELANLFRTEVRAISIQALGLDERPGDFIEFNVYRIIQEAINNIVKHSNAKNVLIECNQIDNKLFITIEDDGVGFDLNKLEANKGIGIQNINNRTKMMNGTLNFRSSEGTGTTIDIEIPLVDQKV